MIQAGNKIYLPEKGRKKHVSQAFFDDINVTFVFIKMEFLIIKLEKNKL